MIEPNNAVSGSSRLRLYLLVCVGALASVYFLSWWLEPQRISNPVMICLLPIAIFFIVTRLYCAWFIFANCKLDESRKPPADLAVDVFVPAFDEPAWLVEKTLRAAKEIQYPHETYLLDDCGNNHLKQMAQKLGVQYLTRQTQQDHKAGNINNALKKTSGEIIAIFDVDHVPSKTYLTESLWPFEDDEIGFVQVRLNHSNVHDSLVAGAAAERNDGFFGIPMHGMHGVGCPQKFGSNCLIRRSALESIGGYQTGLAEDLHTSMLLHGSGWRSAYVSKVLASGLEPIDLGGFFIQQYKWTHGMLQLLRQTYPPLITKLDFASNVCYLWRLTCFLAGPLVALHILITLVVLFLGNEKLVDDFSSYLLHLAPVLLAHWLIMVVAAQPFQNKGPKVNSRLPDPGLLLAYGSWPIYTKAFFSVLFGNNAVFIATPKEATSGSLRLILTQVCTFLLLLAAVIHGYESSSSLQMIVVCSFALLLAIMHVGIFVAAWSLDHTEFSNRKTVQKVRRKTAS